MLFGSDPKWLLLGIMTVTGFLSLWIQNTAAASMMLPIVTALVKQIAQFNPVYSQEQPHSKKRTNKIENISQIQLTEYLQEKESTSPMNKPQFDHGEIQTISGMENANEADESNAKKNDDVIKTKTAFNLMKGFCLSIAYSASIGGSGSLVGTTPNLILKGYFDSNYKDGGLNFVTYMAFAAPVSLIMIFVSWIVICLMWLPIRLGNFLFLFFFYF